MKKELTNDLVNKVDTGRMFEIIKLIKKEIKPFCDISNTIETKHERPMNKEKTHFTGDYFNLWVIGKWSLKIHASYNSPDAYFQFYSVNENFSGRFSYDARFVTELDLLRELEIVKVLIPRVYNK